MARRLAVLNEKGGVAKTTTAVNLACIFAQRGQRTLLIDCDPQKNATDWLGRKDVAESNAWGTADFYLGRGEFAPLRDVQVPGLDLLPATSSMAHLELDLYRQVLAGPTTKLVRALRKVEADYEWIIADCSPTLAMVNANAGLACRDVLVPVEAAPAGFSGVASVQRMIDEVASEGDYSARILGVLATKFEEVGALPRESLAHLRGQLGKLLLETVIHKAQAVAALPLVHRPIVLDDPKSRAAREYEACADEVAARGN